VRYAFDVADRDPVAADDPSRATKVRVLPDNGTAALLNSMEPLAVVMKRVLVG
jgi:hypothetical protein